MKTLIKTGRTLMFLGLAACLLMSLTASAFADGSAPGGEAISVVEVGGGTVSAEAQSAAGAAAEKINEANDKNTFDPSAADKITDASGAELSEAVVSSVELTTVGVNSEDEAAPVESLEFNVNVTAGSTAVAGATTSSGEAGAAIAVTTEGAFIPGRVDQKGSTADGNYFFYMEGNETDSKADITLDGTTYKYGGTFTYEANVVSFNSKVASSTIVVHEALATVGSVGYDTLQGATSAATAGDGSGTVEVQRNGSGDGVIVSSGSVTYNFNSYTYTIDGKLVGSSGTETNGFQLLKDATVVMNNGTIIGSARAHKGSDATKLGTKIVIQNYSSLTLNSMNVIGEASNYVLSNNNNTTNILGNSNITNTTATNCAIDCTWWPSAYPGGAAVIINTTGTVTGNIEMGMYGKAIKEGSNITGYVEFIRPSSSMLTIENVKHNGEITQFASSTGNYGTGLTDEENNMLFEEHTIINGGTFKGTLPAFATVNGKIGTTTIEGVEYTTVSTPVAPKSIEEPKAPAIVEVPVATVSVGGTQQVIDLATGTQNGVEMPVIKAATIAAVADTEEAKEEAAQIVIREVVIESKDSDQNVAVVFTVARIAEGKSLTLSQPIELSIPVSITDLDGYVLCYVDENGKQVEIEFELVDGKIVFKTSYVGAFMLVKA